MRELKTRRILGYSRDSDKGREVTHHINDIANAVCVARQMNTTIYVIEWDEETSIENSEQRGCDETFLGEH